MSEQNRQAREYDALPYGIRVHSETHPLRIAAVAALHGLETPPIDTARVLELGCAEGGNLLYHAMNHPNASFVGVDVSPRQVERGLEHARELDVRNLDLRCGDIAALSPALGDFDYIICHGVYSWVRPDVQHAILDVTARSLSSHGVAVISYNVLPGWHHGISLRALLLHHTRSLTSVDERVSAARELLSRLMRDLDWSSASGSSLGEQAQRVLDQPDIYLVHEYLAEDNEALFVPEFVRRAADHGLRYLDDAVELDSPSTPAMPTGRIPGPQDVGAALYHDVVRGVSFRAGVLARDDAPVEDPPSSSRLARLWVAGALTRQTEGPLDGPLPARFADRRGGVVETATPLMKHALALVGEIWPRSIRLEDLATRLNSLPAAGAPPPSSSPRDTLVREFVTLHRAGAVELTTEPLPLTTCDAARPAVHPAARLAARTGSGVANVRYEGLDLDDLLLFIVSRLDGTRTEADLVSDITDAWKSGFLQLPRGRRLGDEQGWIRSLVSDAVRSLSSISMFVAP